MGFNLKNYDKKALLIILIIFAGLVLYRYLVTLPNEKEFDKHARYTIATITRIQNTSRGSDLFHYYYRVNGRTYYKKSSFPSEYAELYTPGKKIFVKFSSLDNGNCVYLNEEFAPDTLVPPENGWNKLPTQ